MTSASRLLSVFCAWFLYVFCADAALSVFHDLTKIIGLPLPFLFLLRTLLAAIALLYSLALFVVVFITPRVRKRTVLPAALFAIWAGPLLYFPFELFSQASYVIIFSLLQALVGAALLVPFLKKRPLIDESRPAFAWTNLLAGLGVSVVIAILFVASILNNTALAIERSSDGYVRIRPSGLYLEERTFRKGDQEVRLIGMIHIAHRSFYDKLAADFKKTDPAIVLVEGVSDKKSLLKNHFSYVRLASALGFDSQEESSFTEVVKEGLDPDKPSGPISFRRGDIDISDFRPETISTIDAIGDLLSSLSVQDALLKLGRPHSPFQNEKTMTLVMKDIVDLRNERLYAAVQSALATSKVVIVPWGAMHLPYIAKQLKKDGFQEVGRERHRAINFGR